MKRRDFFKRFSAVSAVGITTPLVAGGILINRPGVVKVSPEATRWRPASIDGHHCTTSMVYKNDKKSGFDIRDVDQLKDYARALGVTSTVCSLLCGKKQYKHVGKVLREWGLWEFDYKYYTPDPSLDRNIPAFMKNGVVYQVYKMKEPDPWTMIILHDKI